MRRSRDSLAAAYLSAGRAGKALLLYEQNVAEAQRLLGMDHADTLGGRNNLAMAYWRTGQRAEAIAEVRAAKRLADRALHADHPVARQLTANLETMIRGDAID